MKQASEKDLRKMAAVIRQANTSTRVVPSDRTTMVAVRDLTTWYRKHYGIVVTAAQIDSVVNRVLNSAED